MITSTLPADRRRPMTPGQRVILVLGVPVVLAVVAWTGFGIVAAAGRSSYTITSSAHVTGRQLTMNAGDNDDNAGVTVQGGAATGSVRLSATVGYDLIRPDIRPALNASSGAGGTSVGFSCPADNCQVEAAASVPSSTAVSVTGNGGNVWVSGITAPVAASTGGGDLTLNAVTGTLDLTTDGGNVEGTALAAPDVTVNTGGGNVDLMLSTVPKDLQVNSGGGNVTVEVPPGSTRYHLELDGGCGNPDAGSAVPSSAGSAPSSWCEDVSSSVPDDPSSPNVIVISSGGGQITIT
jgi:hypothetical protein